MAQLAGSAAVRAKSALPDLSIASILAGAYIGLGATVMMMMGVAGAGTALGKFLAAAVFPVGITLVMITAMELWTSNCVIMSAGALQGTCTWKEVFRNWSGSFVGNFIGALAVAYFLVFQAGLANSEGVKAFLSSVEASKMGLTFNEAFLRGIGANWMVCLAVVLVNAAMDIPGKMMGAWFPVMAFVLVGFEHSVANMFLIPLAHMTQSTNLMEFLGLFGSFLKNNLLPVTLGNLVGGAIFTGFAYNRLSVNPRTVKASSSESS
mmetsp:Transcript_12306/g.18350  ORF Transcript_12306/g.18350 Transcript_12306/m.18350 type:complete len:264 (-) Transcript_12306:135-926(-)